MKNVLRAQFMLVLCLAFSSMQVYAQEDVQENTQDKTALTEMAEKVASGAASDVPAGPMQENMSRQMQDASLKMQQAVQKGMKESLPRVQQEQMSKRMNQQQQDTTKQMQEGVQEQLKETIPAIQQKQMSERMNQQVQDTTKQMQDSMQKGGMENVAPKTQQDKE